jgi:drug/metabolite transporter (DMT)-like permease
MYLYKLISPATSGTFFNTHLVNVIKQNQTLTAAGILITVLGALLFSSKAVMVKYAFANSRIDALSLLAFRMLFSLPFYLIALWFINRDEQSISLTKKQWGYILFLGLFGYYLSSLFDFLGLQYISAGLERLILFLYPSFVVFINFFLFKEKISKRQVLALALTYLGILLAYVGELTLDTHKPGFFLGSGLIFICAVTFAIYIAGSGKLIPTLGATRFTAYAMLASTGGVFIHFVARGNYNVLYQSSNFIWYALLLAIVATVIPSFLISAGMKKIGANNVAIISSIGPVSTILQAHFILGEPIFAAQIVGTVLVLLGVLLIGWKGRLRINEKHKE